MSFTFKLPTGGGTGTKALFDDGTWKVPSGGGGSGDVVGPASVTADGNVAVYSGTTGKIIKDSPLKISSGGYIQADWSNATHTSRNNFQTSTTDGSTSILVLPNGTSTGANVAVTNNSNPTNSSYVGISTSATDVKLTSGIIGSGTYLPLAFYVNGSEAARFDISGALLVGTVDASGSYKLKVTGNSYFAGALTATGNVRASNIMITGDTNGLNYESSLDSTGKRLTIGYGGAVTNFGKVDIYDGKSSILVSIDGATGVLAVGTSDFTGGYKLKVNGTINATGYYLNGVALGGAGDVVGPANVTADGNIAIYSGTTGKLIKDSAINISSNGNLNIGIADSAVVKLNSFSDTTNVSAARAGNFNANQILTAANNYSVYGAVAGGNLAVTSDVASGGTAYGLAASARRQTGATDIGDIASLVAVNAVAGHTVALMPSGALTTNVICFNAVPYATSGSISAIYGLLIAEGSSGATVTSRWGVYQLDSTYNNYFNGLVAIGTTDVTGGYKLKVIGTSYLNGTVTTTGDIYMPSGAGIGFNTDGAGKFLTLGYGRNGTTNVGDLVFYDGRTNITMRLYGTGNLHVGNNGSDSGYRLHVYGSMYMRGSTSDSYYTANGYQWTHTRAGAFEYYASNASGAFSWFPGNSTVKMRLTNTGLLLLGAVTDDTSSQLQVQGASRFAGNVSLAASNAILSVDGSTSTLQSSVVLKTSGAEYGMIGVPSSTNGFLNGSAANDFVVKATTNHMVFGTAATGKGIRFIIANAQKGFWDTNGLEINTIPTVKLANAAFNIDAITTGVPYFYMKTAGTEDCRLAGAANTNDNFTGTAVGDISLRVASGAMWIGTVTAAKNINFIVGGTNVAAINSNGFYTTNMVSAKGLILGQATKSTAYTATSTDYTLFVSGNTTITLPAASSNAGRIYNIKKIDAAGTTVTIDPNASETIDGAGTATITTQYQSITIQCDGSNWFIL